MNKKILTVSTLALGAGMLFFTSQGALAYKGDPSTLGPNCTPERHESMLKAFENEDYNSWKDLMQGKGRVTQVVNKGNFAKFAEMHKFRLEGNTDEANKIRTELGLGLGNGAGKGTGDGTGNATGKGYGRNSQ